MAEPIGKVIIDVIRKECTNLTCAYRAGDSSKLQEKVAERIYQKVKHRIADGNEVRILEQRIEVLEKALRMCLSKGNAGLGLNKTEIEQVKKALSKKKET